MAAIPFPVDARILVDRPGYGSLPCVVLLAEGMLRTVCEIDNTNSPAGRAAPVRFREGRPPGVVDVRRCQKEPRSRASCPAYIEMPPYVPAGSV